MDKNSRKSIVREGVVFMLAEFASKATDKQRATCSKLDRTQRITYILEQMASQRASQEV